MDRARLTNFSQSVRSALSSPSALPPPATLSGLGVAYPCSVGVGVVASPVEENSLEDEVPLVTPLEGLVEVDKVVGVVVVVRGDKFELRGDEGGDEVEDSVQLVEEPLNVVAGTRGVEEGAELKLADEPEVVSLVAGEVSEPVDDSEDWAELEPVDEAGVVSAKDDEALEAFEIVVFCEVDSVVVLEAPLMVLPG